MIPKQQKKLKQMYVFHTWKTDSSEFYIEYPISTYISYYSMYKLYKRCILGMIATLVWLAELITTNRRFGSYFTINF